MLSGYLSYMDRDLTGFRKWAKIIGNMKDHAIAHPVAATFIAGTIGLVGVGTWGVGSGIKNTIAENHDAAVARQVHDNLIKPTTPLATSSSWGIQRQGAVMAGRVQYKNAEPGSAEETTNQIFLKSEKPGQGQGGCMTVAMAVQPETTSLLKYVFKNSVVVTHNLTPAFNDPERFVCVPMGVPAQLRSQLPSIKQYTHAAEQKI